MNGARDFRHNGLLALVLLALAVRMLVPAGWMPVFTGGGATISLCTGTGMVAAWVDAAGKIHKQSPLKTGGGDQTCAFAGLTASADVPEVAAQGTALSFTPPAAPAFDAASVAVGHGLAAPPPPATGPPILD